MDQLMTITTLVIIAASLIIPIVVRLRGTFSGPTVLWLAGTAVLFALSAATYLLPADFPPGDTLGRGALLALALITTLTTFGVLALTDMSAPAKRRGLATRWLILGGVWLVATGLGILLSDDPLVGQNEWFIQLVNAPDTSALAMAAGFTVSAIVLIIYAFYVFYRARLPEIANRALFWALDTAILLFGTIMTASGAPALALAGMVAMLTAIAGSAYAKSYHRVFDIRTAMIMALRTLAFVVIGAVLVFTAFVVMVNSGRAATDPENLLIMAVVALFIAALYVPVRQAAEYLIRLMTARHEVDPAVVTREYSQLITEVLELETLVPSATSTLTRLLRVRSCAVILLNETHESAVTLLVRQPGTSNDQISGRLTIESELYKRLAQERGAISQFDVEFSPRYQNIPPDELGFLRRLNMSAYAPITLDYTMIGILAVGPKLNDTAFYPKDLELLATLAQQTGVALRNARLVEDLQHLNTSMRRLNQRLKQSNEQLSRIDSVKSDFVTIASHELRTPLAQVRGYTDIVDALNEQGMLDQEQTNNLISNLRKATERMEELISAMLDVSQLDVDAMDLRFSQSSVETVVRMAIEPLTEAIKQRKLTLSARGLRGLPNIQADLQRLVQAFRNVIVNAIKFTPDGGKITISAELQEALDDTSVDHILVRISDSGVGIDRENLEMIFKKFFRAYDPALHSTGTYKFLGAGPGLGLTIARGVIEGHGGNIWAESPGHDVESYPGATFYILLPVSLPEDAKRVLTFEGTAAEGAVNHTNGDGSTTEKQVSQEQEEMA